MPNDGGNLLFTEAEKLEFLKLEPGSEPYFRTFIGSREFINGNPRYCLWLKDVSPAVLRSLPKVMERVEAVRRFRLGSTAQPTRAAAATPSLFFFISQPNTRYIGVPEVSSERREYIPIGFISPEVIVSNKVYVIATGNFFIFGILASKMHMAWMKVMAGRMKSDYSYSGSMVYNTFPFPETASDKSTETVEAAAQKVLDARAAFPESSLADLYDPLTMPASLSKAHSALDKAVDLCYRPQPFPNEAKRMEFLFELYDKYTAGMFPEASTKKKSRGKK
jgi:hypothetical protein